MSRYLALAYGLIAYLAFFATILYMIGFTGNFLVPKSINDGPQYSLATTLTINILLVAAFAIQHTIMARRPFKQWLTKYIPAHIERSTFVLIASFLLAYIMWQWRPMTTTVWQVDNTLGQVILYSLFTIGWSMVFLSSFLIDHFDLFGLRQVMLHFRHKQYTSHKFTVRSLYHVVRHPLMVGFIIALWSTPHMTQGHMLFSTLMTCYIFVGVALFEEPDLVRYLGHDYEEYRQRTGMFFPKLHRKHKPKPVIH